MLGLDTPAGCSLHARLDALGVSPQVVMDLVVLGVHHDLDRVHRLLSKPFCDKGCRVFGAQPAHRERRTERLGARDPVQTQVRQSCLPRSQQTRYQRRVRGTRAAGFDLPRCVGAVRGLIGERHALMIECDVQLGRPIRAPYLDSAQAPVHEADVAEALLAVLADLPTSRPTAAPLWR